MTTGSRRAVVLAVLLAGVAVHDAWQLVLIDRWNAIITGGRATLDPAMPPQVRFAAAFALSQSGRFEPALDAYRELQGSTTGGLHRDAEYNSANLYLQEFQTEGAAADSGASLALVELAKQSYREVLREDTGDWDARYNLERALRLAPDAEDTQPEPPPPTPASSHAPLTGQGVTLGLP